MRITAEIIRERYENPESRIDGVLQRSLLAHALQFYVDRSQRFNLITAEQAATMRKHISQLERGLAELTVKQHGYVIPLTENSAQKPLHLDEETTITVINLPRENKPPTAGTAAPSLPQPDQTAEKPDARPQPEPSRIAATPQVQSENEAARDIELEQLDEDETALHVVVVDEADAGALEAEKAHRERLAEDMPVANLSPSGTSRVQTGISVPGDDGPPAHQTHPALASGSAPTDIVLGFNDAGSPVIWKPRVSGAPHAFILGIPGQGKSVTVERILIELAKTRTPALVLDFHGTFADPDGAYARRAKPVTLDAAHGLPFSPFDVRPGSSWMEVSLHAKGIAEVIDYVFSLGDIQRDVVYTTIRDLYRRRGFERTEAGEVPPRAPTFQEVLRELTKRSKEANVKNVVARTRSLFEFDLFKPPVEGAPAFDELLKQGVVIGLHRLGGEELALALSAFLLRTVYLNMPSWPIADRIRLVIVLDEAHKLARDVTLPKLMKEGRKYGIAIVAASQGVADFHPDVLGNVGTKISFRINYPDSRKVADFFQGRPGQNLVSVVEGLGVGQALVQSSEMPFAQRAKMLQADG